MKTIILLLIAASNFAFVSAKTFGESCGRFRGKCDPNSDLECSKTGICNCLEPLIWDDDLNKCVSAATEGGKTFGEICGHIQNKCAAVSNLECKNNYCACTNSMTWDKGSNTCVVNDSADATTTNGKKYGEICGYIRDKCESGLNLVCRRNLCACDDSMDWDEGSEKCIKKLVEPGQEVKLPCKTIMTAANGKCVCVNSTTQNWATIPTMKFDQKSNSCISLSDPASVCYSEPIDGVQYKCAENAECVPSPLDQTGKIGYCRCAVGYSLYEDRRCRPSIRVDEFGGKCNASHACNKQSVLRCNKPKGRTQGTCTCIPSSNMFWSDSQKACVGLVNSTCYFQPIGGIVKKCIEHASCLRRSEDVEHNTGYCACVLGFIEYADMTCGQPKINQGFNDSCNSTFSCDVSALLFCSTTGKCTCKHGGDIYDVQAKKCLSPKGGQCTMQPVGKEMRDCIKNSICVRGASGNGNGTAYGTCSCRKTDATGRCLDVAEKPAKPNSGTLLNFSFISMTFVSAFMINM